MQHHAYGCTIVFILEGGVEQHRGLPFHLCQVLSLIKSIDKWQLHSSTLFHGCQRALPDRNCTTVQQTIPKVECRECLGFMLPCLHARHVRLLYLFVTSNTLLQKRRGQSNKNTVSNENNLLPCLSPAFTSSLLAAVQLQRRTNTLSLRTKPLFMTDVPNSLQGDQDKVRWVGGRVT